MANQTPIIVIGIPSFKRPLGLKRLLASLAKLEITTTPTILVIDNDAEQQQALAVVKDIQTQGYRWPLVGVLQPERGISQARNALLKEGFGTLKADFLAMVDDDEIVEPQWLEALLATQAQTQADVVGSWVRPEFLCNEPNWVYGVLLYQRPKYPEGKIAFIAGTGGTLISARVQNYPHVNFSFSSAFGQTGGEDEEFFTRMQRAGATFAFAPSAVVWEAFDASRLNPIWALKRAYRIAQGNIRVIQLHHNHLKMWLKQSCIICGGIGIGTFLTLSLCWHPRYKMRGAVMLARQLGKITALFGQSYKEYAVIHGK